ncbi:MAG TPA: class I SAM-dependent methyltransferase [Bacteroidia bacterium]|nr:class I SAM-dependent methyltransferase [Bacteroidia bacterium]
MKSDNFIEISFNAENIDIYIIRTSILKAIKNSLPSLHGKLLDIGCGKMPYRKFILENSTVNKYVGLDIENALAYDENVKPDFTWDGITMPFEDSEFNCALGTEVLEHCFEPGIILKEVYRVLKPGGVFFFTVPFLWNLHEVPHDEYRYTPFALEKHLKNAGFSEVEIKATGGWDASLAQMIGLWTKRRPLTKTKRKLISMAVLPVIKFLLKKDNPPVSFRNRDMITGLKGIAKK